MYVREVVSIFLETKVGVGARGGARYRLYEDNKGAKAPAENPLSSGRSRHIDVRWHFIRDLVRSGAVRIEHVDPEWQCADIHTQLLPFTLFKRHRRALNAGDKEQVRYFYHFEVCH